MNPAHCIRALAGALALAATTMVWPGCASDPGDAGPTFGEPERTTAVADWDDLDAAVEVASHQSEMAVLDWGRPERHAGPDSERTITLRTIHDESARLVARRSQPLDASAHPSRAQGPEAIDLEARVGLFGNADAERRLLANVKRRLEDLAGVDYAPVRGPAR